MDGEVGKLFPRRRLSLSQLVSELVSLSVHLVSGACYVSFQRLAVRLTGPQLRPQLDDEVLREKRREQTLSSSLNRLKPN